MLGRKVAEAIATAGPHTVVAEEVCELTRSADLFVLNLECCISERGRPWPDPRKPFFFRAPPAAVEVLQRLGVDCVTLANNHALDFGEPALLDTLDHLDAAAIAHVGAGPNRTAARAAAVLDAGGMRLGVIGCADHPRDWAAGPDSAGIALGFEWVPEEASRVDADIVLVTPHWGPNMTSAPPPQVRDAAGKLLDAGVDLIAGHSAHVFHGVSGRVLYDLGDFIDDYAVDPVLRNDLGLLFFVELDARGPHRVEAVPLRLDYCHTRLARGADARWVRERFIRACAELGTEAREREGRLTCDLHPEASGRP